MNKVDWKKIAIGATIAAIVILVIFIIKSLFSSEGFSNPITYGGFTPDLEDFQKNILPPGVQQYAILNAPANKDGFGLLTTGHAISDYSKDAFQVYLKAALPNIEGGYVRFFHNKQVPWPDGKYFAILENETGQQIMLNEVVRIEDGSWRMHFIDTKNPSMYHGFNKILVQGMQYPKDASKYQNFPVETFLEGKFGAPS